MAINRVAPYGAWKSPVTSEALTRETVGLAEVRTSVDDLYWIETRPDEAGRSVIVRCPSQGAIVDVTPPGYNARTLVHEYGGGAYTVADETVFFANFEDQRIYRQEGESRPIPISPEPPRARALRYADFELTGDGRLLYCVRESHLGREVKNEIVCLRTDGSGEPQIVGKIFLMIL